MDSHRLVKGKKKPSLVWPNEGTAGGGTVDLKSYPILGFGIAKATKRAVLSR